jgi:hypothetical protein
MQLNGRAWQAAAYLPQASLEISSSVVRVIPIDPARSVRFG